MCTSTHSKHIIECYIYAKTQVGKWCIKPVYPALLNGVNVAATSPVSFFSARAMANKAILMNRTCQEQNRDRSFNNPVIRG